MSSVPKNTRVRLVENPGRSGVVLGSYEDGGEVWVKVLFDDGMRSSHPASELEEPNANDTPETLFKAGRFGGPETLRRHLVFHKLNGRLADVIYSMGSTSTDYYPHQFKPVIRLLESPARGILIADEVGLGKTIEAGLIWTEWKARFDARRLLVVCPPHLRENWTFELETRFGVTVTEAKADLVVENLEKARRDRTHSFALVASYQGLLAPRGWENLPENHPNPRVRLAHLLDAAEEDEPLIDMLVMDEAHYLRNAESRTSHSGRLIAGQAEYLLLLSATPIMLKNENLWVLLNLIEPETFDSPSAFEQILEANSPLVAARELLVNRPDIKQADVIKKLSEAAAHPLLRGNRQLESALRLLAEPEALSKSENRWALVQATERASLLSHVINRTRKRDVQENRVVRDVRTFRVNLHPIESQFYHAVTSVVRDYCFENVAQGEGLLYVMPQRQVSSSIAAAMRRWSRNREDDEDSWLDSVDRIQGDIHADGEQAPLTSYLMKRVGELGSFESLSSCDSKFRILADALTRYFAENKSEKVVLFAFFRDTLFYLKENLERMGIRCALICGGMGKAKVDELRRFEQSEGPPVLLSSEVGSEGINLQFAKVLVNYDLPWNPMRIEQRIGRLDRIGQKAERILIWNFVAADTIDERIYDRLFLRLQIFEYALGEMEEVLGDDIASLTRDIFLHRLTPEQENQRIEQTAMAIQHRREMNQLVEENASNLTAHHDYILRRVQAARDFCRTVEARDLQSYVCDYFRNHDQQTQIAGIDAENRVFRLSMHFDAAYDFQQFCETIGHRPERPFSHTRPSFIRFSNTLQTTRSGNEEVISQLHPLVRFVTSKVQKVSNAVLPISAIRVRADEVKADKGHYAFHVERWSLTGLRDFEKLCYSAVCLDNGRALSPDEAELLINGAAYSGELWQKPALANELESLWEMVIEKNLMSASRVGFGDYRRSIQGDNQDRIDLQTKLLENHRSKKGAQLAEILSKHRQANRLGLIAATEGKIRKLNERVSLQLRHLQERRHMTASSSEVCHGLLQVE